MTLSEACALLVEQVLELSDARVECAAWRLVALSAIHYAGSKPTARNGRPPVRSVPESDGGATTRGNKATTGQCRLTIAVIPVRERRSMGPDQRDIPEPLILDPADPLPSARAFLERSYLVDGVQALRHQAGVFSDMSANSRPIASRMRPRSALAYMLSSNRQFAGLSPTASKHRTLPPSSLPRRKSRTCSTAEMSRSIDLTHPHRPQCTPRVGFRQARSPDPTSSDL